MSLIIGRLGAINVEQLNELLESLKSSWDYSSRKGFFGEIEALANSDNRAENVFAYEL